MDRSYSKNIRISRQDLKRIEVWLQNQIEQPGNLLIFEEIAAPSWFIWKAKNDFVFRRQTPNPKTLIDSARTMLNNFFKWNRRSLSLFCVKTQSAKNWNPPKQRTLKINVDGAFFEGEKTGAISGILRDKTGVLLDGFAMKVPA